MPKHRRAPRQEQIRISFRASVKFERMLRILRETYKASDRKDALTVPYLVMCAASLEAILNDSLLEHAADKCGRDQKDYGNALLSMNFRAKLDALPLLLTSYAYRFDKEHWIYQRLSSLISERNSIVHPKPQEHDFPIVRTPNGISGHTRDLGNEYYEFVEDLSMGAGNKFTPLEYHEAIEKMDKWFLRRLPDHISKIALLLPNARG